MALQQRLPALTVRPGHPGEMVTAQREGDVTRGAMFPAMSLSPQAPHATSLPGLFPSWRAGPECPPRRRPAVLTSLLL